MEGEWLKTTSYVERPDPVNGVTQEFYVLGDKKVCILDPYNSSNLVQVERVIASGVGSTYAYIFLSYSLSFCSMGLKAPESIPSDILKAQELFPQEDGSLAPGVRSIGSNTVAVLAW